MMEERHFKTLNKTLARQPSTWDAEASFICILSQPGLHSETLPQNKEIIHFSGLYFNSTAANELLNKERLSQPEVRGREEMRPKVTCI